MPVLHKFLLIAFFLLYPTLAFSQDLGLMRLSYIEGDVQVLIKDTTDWTPAAINLALSEGDRIWVAEEGKAELQIRGGVYARMDGNTALDILTIYRNEATCCRNDRHRSAARQATAANPYRAPGGAGSHSTSDS